MQADMALSWLRQPADWHQQRALAAAGWTENGKELFGSDLTGDRADRVNCFAFAGCRNSWRVDRCRAQRQRLPAKPTARMCRPRKRCYRAFEFAKFSERKVKKLITRPATIQATRRLKFRL
jgi:hypothetical protein